MGYYTNFIFSKAEGSREDYEAFLKDVDEIVGDNTARECEYVNAKWYNHGTDMINLTKSYPNLVVSVMGDGEDPDDLWQAYWKGGEVVFSEQVRFTQWKEAKEILGTEERRGVARVK